jgi:hypothetical protein
MLSSDVFSTCLFQHQVYFITHLIKEIKLLGPVFLHQMYAHERFNGILKLFIRNQAYPKGSKVQGYCTVEIIEWALNYVGLSNSISVPKYHHEGRLTSKVTIGKKVITPYPNLFHRAHFHVLQQMSIVLEYLDEHN